MALKVSAGIFARGRHFGGLGDILEKILQKGRVCVAFTGPGEVLYFEVISSVQQPLK